MRTREASHRDARARDPAQRTPSLRTGLIGGLLGAATCILALGASSALGPSGAHASQAGLDHRPRGLPSAADQRIEIIQRLDRINANLEAMRLLMEQQAQHDKGVPTRRP